MSRSHVAVNRNQVLLGVLLAISLASMDQMIVASSMPQIVRDLNGVAHMSWVFTAYMLASTITVPIFGKLSDLYGRRGMYLIAIIIFLMGSVMAGAAQAMWQLVLFRWIQGVGGGAMMVCAVATIGDIIPPAERGRYQGYIAAAFGVSNILGPILGGWISEYFSWRWIFYINLPLGAITLGVLAFSLPRVARVARRSIDYLGALLLMSSLLPFMLVLVGGGHLFAWVSIPVIGLTVISISALVAFVWVERKVTEPIMAIGSFKNRTYLTAIIISFFTAMAMASTMMMVPLFVQGVLNVSPSESGMAMVPMMIGMVISSIVAGQITARTGRYKPALVMGTLTACGAMLSMSHIGIDSTLTRVIVGMTGIGLGLGATFPIISMVVQSAFDRSKIGEVTAGVQLFRSLGSTIGSAMLGGLFNYKMAWFIDQWSHHPFIRQLHQSFPDLGVDHLNGDMIQGMLTFSRQMELTAMFQSLPPRSREWLMDEFPSFLVAVRQGLTSSVDGLFLIGSVLLLVAVIAAMSIPEISLRRGDEPR